MGDIKTKPITKEYAEGYEAAFGKDRKPVRGRWVMTPDGLVPADQYRPPQRAVDAPIIADRIHEGTKYDDGQRVWDLGSRRKRREFMRETGSVEASDYGPNWGERRRAEREREAERRMEAKAEQAARHLYRTGKLKD